MAKIPDTSNLGAEIKQKHYEHFQKYLDSLPEGDSYTVVLMISSLLKGCPWFVIKDNTPEFMQNIEILKTSSKTEKYELANGALFIGDFKTFLNSSAKALPYIFSQQMVDGAIEHRKNSIANFVNFLKSYGNSTEPVTIGILSTNTADNIIVDGTMYKSYAVDLLSVLKQLSIFKFKVVVKGVKYDPEKFLSNKKNYIEYLKTCEIPRSGKGVLIQISR